MTTQPKPVKVLGTDQLIYPKTVDLALLRLLYHTAAGRALLAILITRPWFSEAYARYYNSSLSTGKISSFITEHAIETDLFEVRNYHSFNDFFTRRFKPGQRRFVTAAALMPAFCEGFYSGYASVDTYQATFIKGQQYTLTQLFRDKGKAVPFIGGPLIIARLAPYHYHWFHYVDDGTITDQYHIAGKLHSVDPLALQRKPGILWSNKRDITITDTVNFGKLAYIEVGALTVGKIHQVNGAGDQVARGAEKGYFSFGGSTVLILGEKGKWAPLPEIIAATGNGQECSALLGQEIARRT